jgi:demethylmenaquinone methyltransferase/2-methoxy-6-polyprenyl-1,4-benzoquinol methylase
LQLTGRETLLDVCTGTADIALAASRTAAGGTPSAARVLGIDFSGAMLERGLEKVKASEGSRRVTLARADAMRLPVCTGSVDAVTIGFGIRNVLQPEVACAEIARALRPGGRLAILEFGAPELPGVRHAYRWYSTRVLPCIGRLISGHTAAYTYLPSSVGVFPPPRQFMTLLRQSGFEDVRADPLTFGIVNLYTGKRG